APLRLLGDAGIVLERPTGLLADPPGLRGRAHSFASPARSGIAVVADPRAPVASAPDMASTTPVRPEGSRTGLGPGSIVGGRFEIERAAGEDAIGTLLAARDQKTNRPIAVRVLSPGLIATPQALEILRAEVKKAASIQHKNLVGTYGMGNDPSGARFVAAEWIEGQTLAELAQQRKTDGEPMSLRGAYNVVAHVCRALEAAQKNGTAHGALRPSAVWVTKAGRVKVAGL